MPTLYNQYIYRDGAWRQTGTSSDSVTYQLSLSEDTLTLTGSDGSTSSVSISGGGNSEIFVAHYNETTYTELVDAYDDGKALVVIKDNTICSLHDYDASYNSFVFFAPATRLDVLDIVCTGTYGADDTLWTDFLFNKPIGLINNDGDITTNTTIESGDRLVINDESASRLNNSSITFGTDTTKYLANNGTWQNIPTAPVTSVNSKTGAVNLTASDVGALPDTTEIPEKTSDLTNDSNFVSDANYVHTDNNFTDTLEAKLNGIAEGATVDDHKWGDVALDKTGTLTGQGYSIPVLATSSSTTAYLTSVSDSPQAQKIVQYDVNAYLKSTTPTAGDSSTKVATTAFVSDAIGTAISGVNSFEYEVVQSLPTTNIKDHTIYLVAKTGSTGDVYDEYLYINNAWEHIGSTDVDLSGYVPTTRKVNNKALSSDITLTASDVGALPDSTVIPAQTAKIWTGRCSTAGGTATKVVTLDDATGFSLTAGVKIAILFDNLYEGSTSNTTLNVNNTGAKQILLSNTSEVSAYNSGRVSWGNNDIVLFSYQANFDEWVFCGSYVLQKTAYDLASNAVPKTRTVNGKALSSNITLTASDVGATDEKVKQTPLNGMNSGKGVLFSSSTGGNQTTSTVYTSDKLMWNDYSTPTLTIYNSDKTKEGELTYNHLYLGDSNSSYKSYLFPTTLTANREHILPDKGGTVALTSDIPSATSTTPAMDGTAAVGTETTFAKGDHVHPSDTSKVSKSGDTMTGALTFNRQQNSNSKIVLRYDSDSATMIAPIGYNGDATNNTPIIEFMSTRANSSGSSNYNTILRRIATPSNNYDAANKLYVDTAFSNIDALPSQTGQSGKYLTTNGTTASWAEIDLSTKQDKYTITTATISASGWSNSVYSALQTTYPAASYDIDIELNGDLVTAEQKDAWSAAQIVGSATGNTIKALGDVPTIDIPVIVKATPTSDTYMADVESLLASI